MTIYVAANDSSALFTPIKPTMNTIVTLAPLFNTTPTYVILSVAMYLIFSLFLILTGIMLVIVGGWVIFFAREIKISTRLIDFLFLGPLLAAIKAATSEALFYRLTGR